MNSAAYIDRDPVAQDYPVADETSSSLDSFVSEATLVQAPFKAGDYRHPLWLFPEEQVGASLSDSSTGAAVRKWPTAMLYTSLAIAILIAVIARLGWGTSIPRNTTTAAVEIAQPVANAPAPEPSRDVLVSPAQLTSSILVQPSTRPPVATIVPARAPALRFAIIEQSRVVSREASTSGIADRNRPAPSTATAAGSTRQPSEPTPPRSSTAMNLPAPPAEPILEMPAASIAPAPAVPPASASAAPRPEAGLLPSVAARTEQNEIQRTLAQYRAAYDLLDAEAAQAVWPSVDVRALSRAFDTLASQQLAFDTCELRIAGQAATAECRGSATYVPKIGNRGPRLEPRQWTFRLQKQGESWKIQTAQTKR